MLQESQPQGQKWIPKRNVYAQVPQSQGVSGKERSGNANWKDKQKTWAAAKRKAIYAKPAPKEKCRKLLLSKSFKTTLATNGMLSDSEANCLFGKVMNGAFGDASNDGASKY